MPAAVKEVRDPTTNIASILLNAVTAPDSGAWADIHGRDKFSIHIIITGTATVQLRGSNEAQPADNTDGVDIVAAGLTQLATSATITASTIIKFNNPMLWAKVKVTVCSSGTVTAYLVGV